MADYAAIYSIASSGGTLLLNNGTLGHGSIDDLYWISTIHGLDGPTLRVPQDDVPFGHGGLVHRSWKGPRHPVFEGSLIVQSVSPGQCQAVLDDMETAFNAVLDAMLAPNTGTMTWTTAAGNSFSLTVYYEVALDIQPTENYALRSFNFGLVSPAADPS